MGNSLGDENWSGGDTWYTGYGATGKEEQLDCGARFKQDINNYLATAGTHYKSVQVGCLTSYMPLRVKGVVFF